MTITITINTDDGTEFDKYPSRKAALDALFIFTGYDGYEKGGHSRLRSGGYMSDDMVRVYGPTGVAAIHGEGIDHAIVATYLALLVEDANGGK